MAKRAETIKQQKLNKFIIQQKVMSNLSVQLGISYLTPGNIILRDEQNWRVNEKTIEYFWLVNIQRSFVGWCWLFSIKYKESSFREIKNPEQLTQGIFTVDSNAEIEKFHSVVKTHDLSDKVKDLSHFDLSKTNNALTLDGVHYDYILSTPNSEITVSLSNPNTKEWNLWKEEVSALGISLAKKSANKELIELFK